MQFCSIPRFTVVVLSFVCLFSYIAEAQAAGPKLQFSNIRIEDLRSGGLAGNVVVDTSREICDPDDPSDKEVFEDTNIVFDVGNTGNQIAEIGRIRYIVRGAMAGSTLRTRRFSVLELVASGSTSTITVPFTVARSTDDKVFFGSSQVVEEIGSRLVTIQAFDRSGKRIGNFKKTVFFAEVDRCD